MTTDKTGVINSRHFSEPILADFTDMSIIDIINTLIDTKKEKVYKYTSKPLSTRHELLSRAPNKSCSSTFQFDYSGGWKVLVNDDAKKILIVNGTTTVLQYKKGDRSYTIATRSLKVSFDHNNEVVSKIQHIRDGLTISYMKQISLVIRNYDLDTYSTNFALGGNNMFILNNMGYSTVQYHENKDGTECKLEFGKSLVKMQKKEDGVLISIHNLTYSTASEILHPEITEIGIEYLFRPEFQFLIEMKLEEHTRDAFDHVLNDLDGAIANSNAPCAKLLFNLIQEQKCL